VALSGIAAACDTQTGKRGLPANTRNLSRTESTCDATIIRSR
jgi:hypothetical protein